MKNIVAVCVLMAAAMLVSACETVKGVGKDIENTGEAMDRTF